uniref:Uncharacterized protein n=1 Tax=Quercus lobata TaxID=97700 RepID=A0A7N2MVS6_QUELO
MGLPGGLDCLTRLKTLKVGAFCEELDAIPSLSFIQHLQKSLENLELIGWTKVNSLPDEIQCFTALKRLEIWNFDGMEALPEWLGNLSSLQMLCYCYCKNLINRWGIYLRVTAEIGPRQMTGGMEPKFVPLLILNPFIMLDFLPTRGMITFKFMIYSICHGLKFFVEEKERITNSSSTYQIFCCYHGLTKSPLLQ